MASQIERILILAKTYPSPSARHVETSCVAGINEHGAMRRLYPVPFRLIEEGQKFKKWQWIDVRVEKAHKDHRLESHKLYVDTITCGDVIGTKKQWNARWPWIEKLPNFTSFDDLEATQIETGLSLALMRPKQVLTLEIVEARNDEWTDDEREKLLGYEMQGQLFSDTEVKKMTQKLRKVPFASTTDISATRRRARRCSSTKSSIGRPVFYSGTAARVTASNGRSHFEPNSNRI